MRPCGCGDGRTVVSSGTPDMQPTEVRTAEASLGAPFALCIAIFHRASLKFHGTIALLQPCAGQEARGGDNHIRLWLGVSSWKVMASLAPIHVPRCDRVGLLDPCFHVRYNRDSTIPRL